MRIVIMLSVVALTILLISATFIKYFMAVLKTRYTNKWSSMVLTFLSPSVSLPCHNNVAILRFVYTSDFRVRFTVYTATKNALNCFGIQTNMQETGPNRTAKSVV